MKSMGLRLIVIVVLCVTGDAAFAVEAQWNTYYGQNSGVNLAADGYYNTFVGNYAGWANTSGDSNTCIGDGAGSNITSGYSNVCLGSSAGNGTTTGYSNISIGSNAGSGIQGGSGNIYIGYLAGQSTQGNDNVFVGTQAGRLVDGSQNTLVGSSAGWWSGNSSGNVFIGYNAGYTETGSNKLYIANTDTNFPLIYGDFSTSQLIVYGTLIAASAATPSDERLKTDIRQLEGALASIARLEGVSYRWKPEVVREKGFPKERQTGLLAQNVEAVIPDAVYRDREGYRAVSYDKLVPLLVEAIKEQKKIIDDMKRDMGERDSRISRLEALMEKVACEPSAGQVDGILQAGIAKE